MQVDTEIYLRGKPGNLCFILILSVVLSTCSVGLSQAAAGQLRSQLDLFSLSGMNSVPKESSVTSISSPPAFCCFTLQFLHMHTLFPYYQHFYLLVIFATSCVVLTSQLEAAS